MRREWILKLDESTSLSKDLLKSYIYIHTYCRWKRKGEKVRSRFHRYLESNPVESEQCSIFFSHPVEYTTTSFDGFPRSWIIILGTYKHPFESHLPSLIESEREHMFRISLPSRTRAQSVSDMPSRIPQIWMIYMVSYLDRSEDIVPIHKKEESAIDSVWIIGQVGRDDREKFFIRISCKEPSRTRRSDLKGLPLIQHIDICCFLGKMWERKVEHRYFVYVSQYNHIQKNSRRLYSFREQYMYTKNIQKYKLCVVNTFKYSVNS